MRRNYFMEEYLPEISNANWIGRFDSLFYFFIFFWMNAMNLGRKIGLFQFSMTCDLWINGLSLQVLPSALFNHATKLKELYLSCNQLAKIPNEVAILINLQKLHLSENRITEIPPELSNLKKLQWLYLNHNQISIIPPHFSTFESLKWVFLEYNCISNIPEGITELRNLEALYLSHNYITNISNQIKSMPNLKWLFT